MSGSPPVRAYEEARDRGARHEAQALRVRHALATGELAGAPFGTDKPLVVAPTAGYERSIAVAFLASFNASERDVVFPLKRGLTRIGSAAPFSDFEPLRPRSIEARQWLVVVRSSEAWIMDDHSTNQSAVLPRSAPRVIGAADPRWQDGGYQYGTLREKAAQSIRLDWTGDVVHSLVEGDVLLTIYAAFVFGTMSPSN